MMVFALKFVFSWEMVSLPFAVAANDDVTFVESVRSMAQRRASPFFTPVTVAFVGPPDASTPRPENVMKAEARILEPEMEPASLAFVTAPFAIYAMPMLFMEMSPDTATSAATPLTFPTRMWPVVRLIEPGAAVPTAVQDGEAVVPVISHRPEPEVASV